jgi:hypothetical protein
VKKVAVMKSHTLILVLLVFAFSLLLNGNVRAQPVEKQVTNQQLIWLAYFNRLEISPKWYLFSEVQQRRFVNPGAQHQFLVRSHLHYRLHKEWDVSAGFTYFLQSPHDPLSASTLVVPELRPHVQLEGAQKLSERWSLRHRYRFEHRFFRNVQDGQLAEGYASWFRARYRITVLYRVMKLNEQWLRVVVGNEIHLNFGQRIVMNRFDQNRIYIGANYEISDQFVVELGFLNWYQQRSSGVDFYNRDIVRFILTHRLKLRSTVSNSKS